MKPFLYIDAEFFEVLIRTLNDGYQSEDFDGYNKVRKFIFDPSVNIVLNNENKSDSNLLDDFIRVKGGQALENNGSVIFELKDSSGFNASLKEIGSKSPFSICFLESKKNNLKDYVQKKGFHYIDSRNMNKFLSLPFISTKNVFDINKTGDIKKWDDFKKLSHNFNTIIILDRFLFSRKKKATHSTYKETVSEIVANLAQNNSSDIIDILLVSVKNPGGDVNLSLKEIKQFIIDELNTKKIHKKFNISIARCKEVTDNNHDRLIFTNLCVMFSGNSFNYFEKSTLSFKTQTINTTLSVYSILDYQNWKAYTKILKARKKELPTQEDLNIPNEDLKEGKIEIDFLKNV